MKKIVILGGGFGGVEFYKSAHKKLHGVPGDQEKPARTISVDTAIRQQTDWKVITGRRFDALAQTRPAQIKLIGKREFEEHDDGKRRNVVTWYEPDPAELKVWIARAQDVVSLSKPVVVK